jgi:hypothetical protein
VPGSGYRDTERALVFRRKVEADPVVYMANRSEDEIRRESSWKLSTWLFWGAVCLTLCSMMMKGEL